MIFLADVVQGPARSTANDLYLSLGLLIVSLLALAIVVYFMKRWYERSKNDDADASEFLSEAREMEEEGEHLREVLDCNYDPFPRE